MDRTSGFLLALGASVLWAFSTPVSKVLLSDVAPMPLAGLSYLGAGAGLWLCRLLEARLPRRTAGEGPARREAAIGRADLPWLAAIVACGGILAPVLLLWGLQTTSAAATSLLSSTEVVLTVLLAAAVFGEAVPGRVMAAALLMAAGGAVLATEPGALGLRLAPGALLVVAGSAFWAVDSNLTRRLSHKDPIQLTALKGLLAGATTLAVSLAGGQVAPPADAIPAALAMGFVCYGASLVLYTRALRALGAARTASIFALSPFLGAALSLPLLAEAPTGRLLAAGVLMAAGTVLVVREQHDHHHVHEPLEHDHAHVHDEHHRHEHDGSEGPEPHSHLHRHEALRHAHPHAPDIHHRHRHGPEPSDQAP